MEYVPSPEGDGTNHTWRIHELMHTQALARQERKKVKREARKKRKLTKPLQKRTYDRGSQKRKVKKMVRGQSKR